eukprot:CAMPEP_0197692728 /NCGR_PEP_ID=MMETSP1338-20131121/111525_1 /TAXON_ID=43686 ORGANISM="Pelagodinium beii, Strain RCC1491" /NCGR_SAMPLE_ID=MMETSP1338 /ASSEMBLY_ACC=CAM_ASM_000754 /LENGTH=52 /DNA_ID=CAMNT_0043275413 /DNA_START=114 /DNA_END=269 /DNA_ORIENTATION=+
MAVASKGAASRTHIATVKIVRPTHRCASMAAAGMQSLNNRAAATASASETHV